MVRDGGRSARGVVRLNPPDTGTRAVWERSDAAATGVYDLFAFRWGLMDNSIDEAPRIAATKGRPPIQYWWWATITVMEALREPPLVTEFLDALNSVVLAVPGVRSVNWEDREILLLEGEPEGGALAEAIAAVIDDYRPRIDDGARMNLLSSAH